MVKRPDFSSHFFSAPVDGVYRPRLGCKVGIHRYRFSGPRLKRSGYDPCVLEIEYRETGSGSFHIPMEKCIDCGNERVMACEVVSTNECPNPFRCPHYSCQCGLGNEEHRRRWQETLDDIKSALADKGKGNRH